VAASPRSSARRTRPGATAGADCGRRRPAGGEHRHQRECDDQREHQRERDGQRLVLEQLARDAGDEHHGKEDGNRGQGRGGHRRGDFGRAAARCLPSIEPMLLVAHDALEDHHCVVHQHANGQRDAAQRHDVERQIEGIHQHERAEHRHGDGDAGDERGARVTQESVEHQDRQQAADQRGGLDLADGGRDEPGLVVDRADLGALGQRLAERHEALANAVGERHGVRVALLVDRQFNGFASVYARDRLAVLVAAGDRRHVAQVYRLAVAVGDDGVRHLLDRLELVQRSHQETLRALLEAAAGEVDVLGANAPRHGVDRQAELRELLLVDEDLDFVLVATAHLDRRRALDRLQVGLEAVVGKAAQSLEAFEARALRRVGRVQERESHHGLARRVEAQQQRPLGLERQLQQVKLLAHVDAGEVHVGAPQELQGHVGLAGTRHRAHLAHVADDADGFLDGSRHERLELERRGPRQFGADRERRVGEVGQEVEVQPRQRHEPEQRDRHGAHDHGHAPADRKIDQLHGFPRKLAASGSPVWVT
jgi:hypothetical protein